MIIKKLQENAQKYPNNIALTLNDKKITYKELYEKILYYGNLLKREGNSPVIIYSDKSIDSFIMIFSCLYAKRAYVPIGKCTPIDRLNKIKELTNSSIIIEDDLKVLDKYKDLDIINNDNNIAYIIFTSGSTGEPKGVPISYDNLNNFINWINSLNPLNDYKNINVLNTAAFSFDLSDVDIYYSITNGHTLYGTDISFDNYSEIYDILENVDVAVMTPTFMKMCLLNPDFNESNYPKFKCVYFCGEQLDVNLVKKIYNKFPNINIINAYGPTEATSAVSAILIDESMLDYDLLPCGDINTSATKIEIVDDEIVLSGPSVFNGYINGNSIDKYYTGDLGYIDNNLLYCKGRKDNQIKFKGYRIELDDIQNNANKIDGVKDSIAIAKMNNNTVKSIKLFVITSKSLDYIYEELNKLIPSYMMPNSIEIVDHFPVNENGKIDRKAMMNL